MKILKITFIIALLNLLNSCTFAQNDYEQKNENTEFINTNFHEVVKITNSKLKKHPKNIILLIGDGMGTTQIFAGLTANKGQLNITNMNTIGFSKTQSADNYITDSAAGGTAIACGIKTKNGVVGMDSLFQSVKSILELAEDNKKATGLIATSSITHATPASFIAHQEQRYKNEEIAADFLKTDIDVFIGGGMKYFAAREDSANLIDSLTAKGYTVFDNIDEITKQTQAPLAGLVANDATGRYAERGDMLPKATKTALRILENNKNGFFLMVEGSQIDWAAHQNNIEYMIEEMLDFDKTVGVALEFAIKNRETLVIVTADHETGALSLTGGNIEQGKVTVNFGSGHHTSVMVPVFAFGPGAEHFSGIYENTAIFDKMKTVLRLK